MSLPLLHLHVYYGDAMITLKNVQTGFQINTTIEEAFNKKFFEDYQILTPIGFKNFDYITKKKTRSYYKLTFQHIKTGNELTINLTGKHLIKCGKFIKAAYLKLNTQIENYILVSKQRVKKTVSVFDVVNVEDTKEFIVNGTFTVHNCEEAFLASVFPVVSSSKDSQIIIVSTPNGMNNEYYRIWNKAKLNIGQNDEGKWTPVEINWFDVPGRDEKWKAIQLESMRRERV
jgi:hypothetical protein